VLTSDDAVKRAVKKKMLLIFNRLHRAVATRDSRDWTHLVRVSKLRTMSAMKRPSKPKMPPLAPATAAHLSSNAALKKLPAATPMTFN